MTAPAEYNTMIVCPCSTVQDRFHIFLASKNMSIEERNYDDGNSVVRITWEEIGLKDGMWTNHRRRILCS
jgi:hypothetical protein